MKALPRRSMDLGAAPASASPCSLGPPPLSEPSGGVWTLPVQFRERSLPFGSHLLDAMLSGHPSGLPVSIRDGASRDEPVGELRRPELDLRRPS